MIPPPSYSELSKIAGIALDDGLIFDQQTITAQPIREDDTYAGVRLRLVATLGRAQIPVGIDVNFGDPIWPLPPRSRCPGWCRSAKRPSAFRDTHYQWSSPKNW